MSKPHTESAFESSVVEHLVDHGIYRQALITAAVTGKIDVRGEA
jgi:hypothetical protein